MTSVVDPKMMARRLRARLEADGVPITHSQALESVAASLGFRDWNTCAAAQVGDTAPITVPILRTFPGPEASRFYLEYLGFRVDWEHRYEEGMPLYRQVSKEGAVLHLSEHHGDATPGSAVRIQLADVRSLQRELKESPIYPLRIGLSHESWGDEIAVPDPVREPTDLPHPQTTRTLKDPLGSRPRTTAAPRTFWRKMCALASIVRAPPSARPHTSRSNWNSRSSCVQRHTAAIFAA